VYVVTCVDRLRIYFCVKQAVRIVTVVVKQAVRTVTVVVKQAVRTVTVVV
jgi:hypothetical protein